MIKARKNIWFEKIFALYNRNLFKRRFHSFRISGLEKLKSKDPQTPLIIYANHSSWWDGLSIFEISQAAKLDAFVLMEEKQLRHLRPFRYLGAFSVVRENPREAIKSVNYAVALLKENSRRSLWIFPQGKIFPNDLRPLSFYHGVSRIVEKLEKCEIVSCALRFEFLENYKPEIFAKIGLPQSFPNEKNLSAKQQTINFQNHLTVVLDELKSDVLTNNLANYENLF